MNGKLYVVGTPIGNLEDITYRAVRILKEVDLVLCEDTRESKKLLDKYEIETPTASYHQHSGEEKENELVQKIEAGRQIALISDAGTPGISDPGGVLVSKVVEADLVVEVIPGPSALTALASIAGIPVDRFLFLGFLPHKKGRKTMLDEIKDSKRTVAVYESVHRIMKLLDELGERVEGRKVVVGRELTKKFEEVRRQNISELIAHFTNNKPRGEFIICFRHKP